MDSTIGIIRRLQDEQLLLLKSLMAEGKLRIATQLAHAIMSLGSAAELIRELNEEQEEKQHD